jgi:hypothetical protein
LAPTSLYFLEAQEYSTTVPTVVTLLERNMSPLVTTGGSAQTMAENYKIIFTVTLHEER